jgi:hypothetical protein
MQKDQRTVGGNSNEMQDVAAALLLGKNKNFLDLGAGRAKGGNNTYLLQKKLGWEGCCFDLREEGTPENDESRFILNNGETYKERGNTLHNVDCTTPAFLDILKENAFPQVVDYVSLDVDAASIEALINLVLNGNYIFKFLTYEHDLHYSLNFENQRNKFKKGALNERLVYEGDDEESWPHPFSKAGIESRKYRSKYILEERGYRLLFENVSVEAGGGLHPMEDWWINPQYFPADITSLGGKNLHFFECIKRLINISASLHTKETFDLIKEHCFEDLHS